MNVCIYSKWIFMDAIQKRFHIKCSNIAMNNEREKNTKSLQHIKQSKQFFIQPEGKKGS